MNGRKGFAVTGSVAILTASMIMIIDIAAMAIDDQTAVLKIADGPIVPDAGSPNAERRSLQCIVVPGIVEQRKPFINQQAHSVSSLRIKF